MKKYIVFLFWLGYSLLSVAQKDTRSLLKMQGRINELSVSPSGSIWLATAIGTLYYTDSITGYWHSNKQFHIEEYVHDIYSPHLERVTFFNKDTAIISGYFSVEKKGKKNGLYRTTNGGENWKLINFGGDSWIYDCFALPTGQAWIGGSSGDIYYSNDFGEQWKKLKTSFGKSNRMHSIFMLDSNIGIVGALHNEILITNNNWKTAKSIKTPYDQRLYKKSSEYSQNKIEKIRFWNDYIVVNQDDHIYYTAKDKIKWVSFPIALKNFEISKTLDYLYAIDSNNQVVRFNTPDNYIRFNNEERIEYYPLDMKIIDDAVYCIDEDNNIYYISQKTFYKARYYTYDKEITTPKNAKKATFLTWGTEGKDIYISEDYGKTWYRDTVADFYIADFSLKNDSIAIFWTGRYSYKYNRRNRTFEDYELEKPLADFLQAKAQTVIISSGSAGCYHSFNDLVKYQTSDDEKDTFSVKEIQLHDTAFVFKKQFSQIEILNALQNINNTPYHMPLFADFDITKEDKEAYISFIEKSTYMSKGKKRFCKKFAEHIDTLAQIPAYILGIREMGWSTTHSWFTIEIFNAENEKIVFSNQPYFSLSPWQLPIQVEYKGYKFLSYNIAFQKFIASLLPSGFNDKEAFSNVMLIYKLAELYYKESHEEEE